MTTENQPSKLGELIMQAALIALVLGFAALAWILGMLTSEWWAR